MKIVTVLENVPIMLPMLENMKEGKKLFKDVDYIAGDWLEKATEDAFQKAALEVEVKGANGMNTPRILEENLDADIVLGAFCPFPNHWIDKTKSTRIIGITRGGIENIDLASATKKGIAVFNAAGRNANAVSDFTIGMILSEVRNIAKCHYQMKQGIAKLSFPNSEYTPDLQGKTIGLVGFGNIGRLVAKKLEGFDVSVITYDPFITDEMLIGTNATLVEKEELFREADIVSVHARLTKDTMNLIGKTELSLMKPHSYFINTARAGLVDYGSLYEVLKQGKIAGAALDVYDVEPLPPDSPWIQLDNVTLTSHLGGATYDAQAKSPCIVYEKIRKFIEEDEDRNVINKEVLENEELEKWRKDMKKEMI